MSGLFPVALVAMVVVAKVVLVAIVKVAAEAGGGRGGGGGGVAGRTYKTGQCVTVPRYDFYETVSPLVTISSMV